MYFLWRVNHFPLPQPGVTTGDGVVRSRMSLMSLVCEVAIISGIIPALSPDNASPGHRLTYSVVIIRNNLAAHITAVSLVPTNTAQLSSYHDTVNFSWYI